MATEVGSAYVTLIPSAKGFASRMQRELGGDLARYGQQGGADYSRGFSDSGKRGIASRAKGMFSGLAKGGALAAAAAGVAVGKVLTDSIGEAREAAVVTARTENVIKKMGNAANISADQVADLSGALSAKAGVDDEVIQSGANLLLTFGNVRNEAGKGNDIFNQTTGLMVDMSRAMGTDAKSAALQLGKALNDPAKGVTALTRSGVSFTQAQKDQIAALQESGDMMGAQKIILSEVEKQFGGAAAAMATPADRAKVAWGNFQEEIGTALLPLVDKVLTALADALPRVITFGKTLYAAVAPVVARLVPRVQALFSALSGEGGGGSRLAQVAAVATRVFAVIRSAVAEVVAFVQAKVIPGVLRIGDAYRDLVAVVLPKVRQIVDGLMSKWGEVEPRLRAIWGSVKSIITDAMVIVERVVRIATAVVSALWERFGSNIVSFLSSTFSNVVQVLRGAFQVVQGIFKTVAALLKGDWAGVWEGIKLILRGAWNVIIGLVKQGWNVIKFAFQNAGVILKGLLSKLWAVLKGLVAKGVSGLVALVKAMPRLLLAALSGLGRLLSSLLSKAWDLARNAVTSGVDRIVDLIRGMPGKIKALGGAMLDAAKALGGKIIDGIKNGLSAVGGVAGDIAAGVGDALESVINGAIDAMNSAIPDKLGWGKFAIDIDNSPIPHVSLATGGRVTGATVALIGEGREPETVLPDSMLRGLLERSQGGGVGLLTITNWRDGTGYFRLVADEAQGSAARYSRHLGAMNA